MKVLAVLCLLALAGSKSRPDIVELKFDMLEVNVVYGDYGQITFVQLLALDWVPEDHQWKVQAWAMIKDAFDATDPAHRKKWEEDKEKYISQFSDASVQSRIRDRLVYQGKLDKMHSFYPAKDFRTGQYRALFHHEGLLFSVKAKQFQLTCTPYDRERANRDLYKEDTRRGWNKPPPLQGQDDEPSEQDQDHCEETFPALPGILR